MTFGVQLHFKSRLQWKLGSIIFKSMVRMIFGYNWAKRYLLFFQISFFFFAAMHYGPKSKGWYFIMFHPGRDNLWLSTIFTVWLEKTNPRGSPQVLNWRSWYSLHLVDASLDDTLSLSRSIQVEKCFVKWYCLLNTIWINSNTLQQSSLNVDKFLTGLPQRF